MDFLARLAVGQVRIAAVDFRVLVEQAFHALLGLVELLLLQLGQVHRHVAAKGHGHGLDNVHQGYLGTGRRGQFTGALDDRVAFFGQVDGNQYVFVGHEKLS
ncbi:hypothetical protein D3C84_1059120 [compost metagenome]